MKEESEKTGLKLNIQKTKIMTSGLITSWQIDGETMETVTEFIFLGFKITADGDCSHEIKRRLLLGRKAMTNLNSILKSRGRYSADKDLFSKSYGFSSSHVWLWELGHKESWVLKNWCFWTVVLEKTLSRVPWTASRSNQSILKEISHEYSLERLVLKLKLQYFGHLMRRANSLGRLNAGGEGDDRGWDSWMACLTQWTWAWANSGRYWRTGKPGMLQVIGSQRVGHDLVTEQQQNQYIIYINAQGLFQMQKSWAPPSIIQKSPFHFLLN